MGGKPKSRTIIEPLAEATIDSSYSPIKSLAVSTTPDGQTLIYVSTLSGALLLYTLRTRQGSDPEIAFIRRTSLPGAGSGGGASMGSIHALVNIGKIMIVSDGYLFLVDSSLLEPAKRFSLFRGVTAYSRKYRSRSNPSIDIGRQSDGFDGDDNSNGVLFAVGTGKKLIVAQLVFGGTLVIEKEIQGAFDGGIMALMWIDDSIFVGTTTSYYLYDYANGQCGLIFSLPDPYIFPRIKLFSKESRVLLMMENVGIIVDLEGHPVGGSLVFKDAPDTLMEIGSYVVAAKGLTVELYHKKTGYCAQSFVVGNGAEGRCLLADEENVMGNFIAVATSLKLTCYGKVSEEEQIKDLLRKKYFKEAISLVEELGNEEMLSSIHAQVGLLLIFDLQFSEAVNHFLLAEKMQPSEVFPFVLQDPNRWSLQVPRNRYWGLHPPPKPLENVIDDGLNAIQRAVFLKKAGVDTTIDDEFLQNPPSRAYLLQCAIENMIRYFKVCRERDLVLSVMEGVDTLLMYLYRAINRTEDMEMLASSDNNCVVEELETLLAESGHLRALAFLYASKGLGSKALSIWRSLLRNYSSNGYDKYQSEDFDMREAAAVEASKIMEGSSDQDLILQHLGWIADVNPVLAINVLISEKRENLLSPDEVIAAIDPKKTDILQRERLYDTKYHTAYALLLAKSVLATFKLGLSSEDKTAKLQENGMQPADIPVRERLRIFLGSSDLYDTEKVLYLIEESELWLEKAILYRRLGQENLVLQILALKLNDFRAAEEYCTEIGRPDAYIQLFEMYLDPEDGREPMFKAAIQLLHKHGEMLNPAQVLDRLPANMPLHLASDTIIKILRARHHHYLQGQIEHKLSRALDLDAKLSRLEERSRYAQINDGTVCDSCQARLGTKLFAMYPDDTIVCYKCYRRRGETSTGKDSGEAGLLVKPGWLVTR